MNKIYRIVFNQATQTWTAVAENAHAKGKSGRTTVGSSKLSKLMGVSAITAAALLSTQAMAEDTYFHVNTGTNSGTGNATTNLGGVTEAAGATATGAIAAGMNAQAKGSGSLALGQYSYAASNEAVAIGVQAGIDAAMADRTIMIGSQAGAQSSTTDSVLMGSHSAYNRTGSGGLIAIGNGAGSYEMSTTENPGFPEDLSYTTAIGFAAGTNATGSYNDYIGGQAGYYRHGDQNVSMGYLAGAAQASYKAVDITGIRTGAMGHDNVFFGTYSGLGLNGNDNIAIGQMSNAAWKFDDANKTGSMNDESIKVAYVEDTIAIGQQSTAQKNTAIAIGKDAKAAVAEGDVALGAGSVTRAVTPTSSATVNGITYGTFAGATPTSAVSVGAVGSERQIQNVAAGQISATSTDAINGSQLYAVAASANRTNYFHVNTGNANQAAGNAITNEGTVDAKGGATATGAIAAGVNATATAGNTIAIGQGANSAHANSVVIGAEAKSSSLMGFSQATAVGYQAHAANDSVAIGSQAVATGATTTTTYSGWATAVGRAAQATGLGSVAMGNEANASHIGTVAVGPRAAASGREAAAFGGTSSASGYAALAAGYQSDASANFATALGNSAWATAANATAVGSGARATGAASLAAGGAAQTQAFQSAAFGNGASVYADGVQALALGANATTNDANAVALGSGARTAAAVGTRSATINGVTYDGFAGTEPIATVSVGNDTQKRTITNVAAGQINATSTDAINGSQLYAVADKLTADIKAADTNTVTTVTAGKNITVENIGTADAPNYQVATADQVVFDSVSITNGPTINNNGINMNGNRITNVARGINGTDAVNVDQLNDATSGIYGRIDNLDKDYRAGVAGNAAMVNIPQVTRPGANLLGIGLGHHKGESAVAVGFSSSSDNEQLIFKMSGSANTQGDFTIGSGLGWQW